MGPFNMFDSLRRRLGRGSCTGDAKELLAERNRDLPRAFSPTRTPVSLSYDSVQDNSVPLLSKLPIEIRRLVYAHALGNRLVHLIAITSKLAHFGCEGSSVSPRICVCRRSRHAARLDQNSPYSSVIAVNLLRANRQIYAEALPVLYSSNIFDIDNLSTFNIFANNVPPAGRSLIRRIHLNWWTEFLPLQQEVARDLTRAPYDDATYQQFWHIVTNDIPALKGFLLYFATSWFFRDLVAELALPWAQPIQQMRNLDYLGVGLIEDVSTQEDRQEQLDEFAAKLGAVVCNENAKIVTRVLSREDPDIPSEFPARCTFQLPID